MNNETNTKSTHSKEPKRAVCYLRVARSLDGDSSRAIDAQREACEHKARELGATVVEVYTDAGVDSTINHRPALKAMLARLDSDQRISYVLVWDHDRLARNVAAYRQIVQAFEAAGIELITVKEQGLHLDKFMHTLTTVMADLAVQHRRQARRAGRKAI